MCFSSTINLSPLPWYTHSHMHAQLPEDTTVYETITDVSTSTCNLPHSSSVLQAIENTADRRLATCKITVHHSKPLHTTVNHCTPQ